jgi:uncharacterized protein (TIGR00725 family)
MTPTRAENNKLKYSICISGAASGETVDNSHDLAKRLGEEIAKNGHVLTTGATVGLPYYAAWGAKKAGGMSIGFSPASSFREHSLKYRLPTKYFDFINFTGMDYVGRDVYLVQSSDAVITVGGRFGSLHEFTTALESRKPCGILLGSGGTADEIPKLMEILEPPHRSLVIYDDDPERLVVKVIQALQEKYKGLGLGEQDDDHWFLQAGNHAG